MKNIESRSANIFQIPLGKGLTIASPESVILEFGDKGTLDVGALCYLTRDAKFNRQRRHLAKPVDLSSYCSVRSEYVGRFILHISDSVSSGLISIPTAYYQLQQGFMSYVNWCDSNEIYDSFYTEISSRSAFAKYNQYVSDRMARGEISSLTAGHTVRPLLKVLNSFLGIDNLHHGVNLVRKNINDNNPTLPAGEADQAKSLSLFKAIFDGFRDLVLNNKEYPYSIGVPKYLGLNNDCLWVFPLKKWFMHPTAKSRNIDAAKKFTAYNFKEGRVESPRVSQRLRGLSTGGFGLLDELQIIPILSLGRWDVADGLKESLMVEPGHPFEGGELQGFDRFPGRPAVNQFSLVQTVDGFG